MFLKNVSIFVCVCCVCTEFCDTSVDAEVTDCDGKKNSAGPGRHSKKAKARRKHNLSGKNQQVLYCIFCTQLTQDKPSLF